MCDGPLPSAPFPLPAKEINNPRVLRAVNEHDNQFLREFFHAAVPVPWEAKGDKRTHPTYLHNCARSQNVEAVSLLTQFGITRKTHPLLFQGDRWQRVRTTVKLCGNPILEAIERYNLPLIQAFVRVGFSLQGYARTEDRAVQLPEHIRGLIQDDPEKWSWCLSLAHYVTTLPKYRHLGIEAFRVLSQIESAHIDVQVVAQVTDIYPEVRPVLSNGRFATELAKQVVLQRKKAAA